MLARWAGDRALNDGEEEWGAEATEMLELVAYQGLSITDNEPGKVSTDDVEKLLEFQVEQMQSESRCEVSGIWLMVTEHGTRIPVEVRDKFKSVLDDSIMIPSMSHYVKSVAQTSRCYTLLTVLAFWTLGELETILHHLTTSIVISTTPCKIEIGFSTSMLS